MAKDKKHAPIEQLREAGRIATEMLRERKILSPKSSINEILANPNSPVLPGIPAYLPYPWTLTASREMMRNLVYMWKNHFEDNPQSKEKDDVVLFWRHVLKEVEKARTQHREEMMRVPAEVKKLNQKLKDIPVMSKLFAPMQKVETDHAIYKFLCDSFAVAKVQNRCHDVAEFLEWYVDWTQDLYELWVKPKDRKNIKRV